MQKGHALIVAGLGVILGLGCTDESSSSDGDSGDGSSGGQSAAGVGGASSTGSSSTGAGGTSSSSGSGSGGSSDAGGSAGSAGTAGTSSSGGSGGETPEQPSSACGASAPATAPSSIEVGDQGARTFIVDVPADYDPNVPTPIVFGFHGRSTSGELFRSQFYGNLGSTLNADYIVVYPDAQGDPTSWEVETDIPFFDAMLGLMKETYCIDEARVFATGHSAGGYFSNTLGCDRGDVLRAIAPVSGGGPFAGGCVGEVAALMAHGLSDMQVLTEQGEASRDHWAEANGCDLTMETSVSADYPCVEYAGCLPGLPVRWCPYEGEHNPPDFAPQAIHDFFSSL